MKILHFETNVPTEVALEYSQGVVVEGRYGALTLISRGRIPRSTRVTLNGNYARQLSSLRREKQRPHWFSPRPRLPPTEMALRPLSPNSSTR